MEFDRDVSSGVWVATLVWFPGEIIVGVLQGVFADNRSVGVWTYDSTGRNFVDSNFNLVVVLP